MGESTTEKPTRTVGLDVGDRSTYICVLNPEGEILEEGRIPTTEEAYRSRFECVEPLRVVLEVGPHSPRATRLLGTLGHEVIADLMKRRGTRRGKVASEAGAFVPLRVRGWLGVGAPNLGGELRSSEGSTVAKRI